MAAGRAPRVAWIAPHVPEPATSGARVYSKGLMSAVARAGAQVTFMGLLPCEGSSHCRSALDPLIEWHVLGVPERGTVPALASSLPLVTARVSPTPIVEAARRLFAEDAARFDAIVIDNYAAGWILDHLPEDVLLRHKLVYVAHNDETALAADIANDFRGDPMRKTALRINAWKIRRLEQRLLRQSDLVVTLTAQDRDAFRRRRSDFAALVVPPGYSNARRDARVIDENVPRRLTLVGSLHWIAKRMNVAAFLAAADRRFHEAGIALDIIGDVPDDFRVGWAGRLLATTFRGFAEDLGAEMQAARLGLVIEATGGGFKLKTLDYIFQRVPVAALENSCAGLPSAVTRNFLIEPDVATLVGTIIAAIDDLPRLNRMQKEAFGAAATHFDWDVGGRALADALRPRRPSVVAA